MHISNSKLTFSYQSLGSWRIKLSIIRYHTGDRWTSRSLGTITRSMNVDTATYIIYIDAIWVQKYLQFVLYSSLEVWLATRPGGRRAGRVQFTLLVCTLNGNMTAALSSETFPWIFHYRKPRSGNNKRVWLLCICRYTWLNAARPYNLKLKRLLAVHYVDSVFCPCLALSKQSGSDNALDGLDADSLTDWLIAGCGRNAIRL